MSAEPCLELVKTLPIPAIPPFDVRAHFNPGATTEVVIGDVGDHFWGMFASERVDREDEPEMPATILQIHNLVKPVDSLALIAELGEVKAGITLGQMWEVLKVQGQEHDEESLPFIICFVRLQQDGELWVVCFGWESEDSDLRGWEVGACKPEWSGDWNVPAMVISRAA